MNKIRQQALHHPGAGILLLRSEVIDLMLCHLVESFFLVYLIFFIFPSDYNRAVVITAAVESSSNAPLLPPQCHSPPKVSEVLPAEEYYLEPPFLQLLNPSPALQTSGNVTASEWRSSSVVHVAWLPAGFNRSSFDCHIVVWNYSLSSQSAVFSSRIVPFTRRKSSANKASAAAAIHPPSRPSLPLSLSLPAPRLLSLTSPLCVVCVSIFKNSWECCRRWIYDSGRKKMCILGGESWFAVNKFKMFWLQHPSVWRLIFFNTLLRWQCSLWTRCRALNNNLQQHISSLRRRIEPGIFWFISTDEPSWHISGIFRMDVLSLLERFLCDADRLLPKKEKKKIGTPPN